MSDYVRYDYAWVTPGWTIQNPTFNYATNSFTDPGMPDDVSLVRVYGTFMEMDSGRGLEGVLRLRTDVDLTHVPTGRLVPAGDLRPLRFPADGFSLYLPATDDPDLTPAFTYHARLTIRGTHHEFDFALPAATPEVNILTLIAAAQA